MKRLNDTNWRHLTSNSKVNVLHYPRSILFHVLRMLIMSLQRMLQDFLSLSILEVRFIMILLD